MQAQASMMQPALAIPFKGWVGMVLGIGMRA
jgi:hypothetical protein